jgi:hypothetical protein
MTYTVLPKERMREVNASLFAAHLSKFGVTARSIEEGSASIDIGPDGRPVIPPITVRFIEAIAEDVTPSGEALVHFSDELYGVARKVLGPETLRLIDRKLEGQLPEKWRARLEAIKQSDAARVQDRDGGAGR